VRDRPIHVGYLQSEVNHAVTVGLDVVAPEPPRARITCQDKAGPPGYEHVLGVITMTGLRAAVCHAGHPERCGVVVRRLPSVADCEAHVIHVNHREQVDCRIVGDGADQRVHDRGPATL